MPAYHVFVDGAADSSTVGKERLANAIAEHYGLPVADLRTRIASGRFRVKGNCDGATADMYVRDLTRLGARCSIEEATPHNKAITPLPFPAVTPNAAAAATSSSRAVGPTGPPTALGRTTLPPATAPRATSPPATKLQSGLSAAYSGESPVASLGALEGDGLAFTLASVDGGEDAAPPPKPASFAPPSAAASKPTTTKAAKPADVPLDMFAPPETADEAAFKVELAPEEIERSARKRASTPPPGVAVVEEAVPVAQTAGRYSRPSLQVQNTAPPVPERKANALANPNLRFVLGVVIAIGLGFIPAHLVAAMREKSAFEAVDAKVIATQKDADTPDAYAALDGFRNAQLDRKHDDRRTIAIMALVIWGLAGAGVAYVWFRRIPWQRFDA